MSFLFPPIITGEQWLHRLFPSVERERVRFPEMSAGGEDQRVFYELCALVFSVIKSPPGAVSVSTPRAARVGAPRRSQVTPAAFVSLLLGISLALMLCGSVTFVIGFMLMPWVLGMVMVLYFVGIVSSLSAIGRAILCPSTSSPKEMQG